MMNCTDFQNLIDDYSRADLSPEVMSDAETHLASCLECTKSIDEHNNLVASLKAMPVAGPSEGFAGRVLRVAALYGKEHGENRGIDQHHRRGFMVGFGSAAAAALALWVVVGVFPQQMPQQRVISEMASVESNVEANIGSSLKTGIPWFSIALNEQRDIKLAFFSSEDLKGATITLHIPETIALVGYEGQRKLVWKTNLARGDNTLRLPIMATSVATNASGEQLVAHIEYKGKVRTLKVNLAIGESQSTPGLSGSTGMELTIV
jgi:hypothetical protein